MNKLYGIVQITNDMVIHHGIYPYHEAVGHLICQLTDITEEWLNNEYTLTKQDDFVRLEGDTGFGWFRSFKYKKNNIIANESWYLLELPESERNIDTDFEDKLKIIENHLNESRYFSKEVRQYLYEIELERPLSVKEKELWNKTHDVHIHTNDASMLIQSIIKQN